ncbi:unnamed protein product [Caenorhabditis sp. 36 PRJEB53466]|nr:unnamed protein product [Caenorhabditis sp. 36 PRJEB53466]
MNSPGIYTNEQENDIVPDANDDVAPNDSIGRNPLNEIPQHATPKRAGKEVMDTDSPTPRASSRKLYRDLFPHPSNSARATPAGTSSSEGSSFSNPALKRVSASLIPRASLRGLADRTSPRSASAYFARRPLYSTESEIPATSGTSNSSIAGSSLVRAVAAPIQTPALSGSDTDDEEIPDLVAIDTTPVGAVARNPIPASPIPVVALAALAKEQHRRVLDMEFYDNEYPTHTFTPVERKYFKLNDSDSRAEVKTAIFEPEIENNCSICFQSADLEGVEELFSCQGCINGCQKLPCKTKYHLSCILKYNSGHYNFQYAARPECQDKLLCPLHCCAYCDNKSMKQTAYMGGKLTECALCLRSFHTNTCLPAGMKSFEVTFTVNGAKHRTEMMICPKHVTEAKPIRKHIDRCFDCAKTKDLIRCRTCIRSFHRECVSKYVQTVDRRPACADQCVSCMCQDPMKVGTPVLVLWTEANRSSFHLAHIRDWYMYPNKDRCSNRNFNRIGYCVVQWVYEKPKDQFSLVAVGNVTDLEMTYLPLAGANVSLWKKTLNSYDAWENMPTIYKKVKKEISSCKYTQRPLKQGTFHETEPCKCVGDARCTTAECPYFLESFECPAACNKKGPCQNRKISAKHVNPKMELRKAGLKGYGVFATGHIKEGEFLVEYAGEIINREEKDRRTKVADTAKDRQANRYMMESGEGMTIDASVYGNIARYINHSCDPNSGSFQTKIHIKTLQGSESVYETRIFVKTIRAIEPDEEITFDYMMDNTEGTKCRCGAECCSGVLKGTVEGNVEEMEEEEEEEEDEDDPQPGPSKKSKRSDKKNLKRKFKTSSADTDTSSPPAKRTAPPKTRRSTAVLPEDESDSSSQTEEARPELSLVSSQKADQFQPPPHQLQSSRRSVYSRINDEIETRSKTRAEQARKEEEALRLALPKKRGPPKKVKKEPQPSTSTAPNLADSSAEEGPSVPSTSRTATPRGSEQLQSSTDRPTRRSGRPHKPNKKFQD